MCPVCVPAMVAGLAAVADMVVFCLVGAGLWKVGLTGLEPVTSALSGRRSNHLSYRPAWAGTPRANTTESRAIDSTRLGTDAHPAGRTTVPKLETHQALAVQPVAIFLPCTLYRWSVPVKSLLLVAVSLQVNFTLIDVRTVRSEVSRVGLIRSVHPVPEGLLTTELALNVVPAGARKLMAQTTFTSPSRFLQEFTSLVVAALKPLRARWSAPP